MRRFVLALLLMGCRKTPSPSEVVATVEAGTDASVTVVEVGTVPDAAVTANEMTPTKTLSEPKDLYATASTVQAINGGALVVYATPESEGSNVVGEVWDEDGHRVGSPHLLRRTSGEVQSLAVVVKDATVWVGWGSKLLTEDKHLAAFVKTDVSFAKVTAPVTLLHEALDGGEPGHWIRATAIADGVMFATRSSGKSIPCIVHTQPYERCPAPGLKVFIVSGDDPPRMVRHVALDGNPLQIAPLLNVNGAVAIRVHAWHGGAIGSQTWYAVGDAGTPPIELPLCNPPFDQAWTGDELVTLCDKDYPSSPEQHCPVGDAISGCPRFVREKADGGTTSDAFARAIEDVCVDGHPAIRVTRADKSTFVIDPTKPGAIVPRFAGWTGKVLLAPKIEGNAMPLARRVCKQGVLTSEP